MNTFLKKAMPFFLVAMLVFTAFVPVDTQAAGTMTVRFIDVGQGDSTFVKFPSGHTMLIDGGKKGSGKTVVSKLKGWKVKKIDTLVATHPDADHIGGLITVLNDIPVKSVYAPKVSNNTKTYEEFLKKVKAKKLTIKTAKKGVTLPVGTGATAKMVAPVKEYAKSDTNNWSAVIRVAHGKNTFLFTGDAESKSEKDMIASKQTLSAKVLKVGHHGSKNSTTSNFLNKVKPKYAVISVGRNSYGHPTSEILNRLKKVGATIYRTDQKGIITVISSSNKVKFSFSK